MPKQEYTGGVLRITEDINDPQDNLEVMKKTHKGKKSADLTDKEKADLFDAYVDAGVITL